LKRATVLLTAGLCFLKSFEEALAWPDDDFLIIRLFNGTLLSGFLFHVIYLSYDKSSVNTWLKVVRLLLRLGHRAIQPMKTQKAQTIDIANLNAELKKWQKQNDTPEKVAAEHRKVLLDRVVQSMSFENQPVSMDRLKTLLKKKKR
jgi:hypothetical protein